ncbi:Glyceraldehyde-3-phosphate dehydrogenase [Psilocybe cubensis]|uniref:Glyceraldehyde-3-phosphate dehydrogenase n=1 Tax=Psilocybe cubensis TaxID=181762 RepID=A0ACB8GNZ2_PSICU|nr:Glyceraldehyde-3-phosphate dehydrogenase [Psilocybe cubensis]KAH9476936.1 Glyceraldehyde-3-phosphate dehydrogenase [Psilocybe cubensis]
MTNLALIGRIVLRNALELGNLDVIAINDPFLSLDYMVYLFKYDSVHGRYKDPVEAKDGKLYINERPLHVFNEKNPAAIKWGSVGVEYIVESTGIFTTIDEAQAHLKGGAKKVVITALSDDAPMYVYGINHKEYKGEIDIVSNASCTTNCLAPLAKIVNDKFGIIEGLMTAAHATTGTYKTMDVSFQKDTLYDTSGCSANSSSIPSSSTGAAKAVGKIIPELKGRLNGVSFRLPIIDASVVDLVVRTRIPMTEEEVIDTFRQAAESPEYKGIMGFVNEPLVSSDFVGSNYSSIFDAQSCLVMNDNYVKMLSWYDNEWGYSRRVCDLVAYISSVTPE